MAYDSYDEPVAETKDNNSKDDSKTGLLPKSFFGDKSLEPGKVCKVEIEHVYEDEVSVRYIPHSEAKEDDKEPEEPEETAAEPESEEAMAGPSTATSEPTGPYD